MSLLEAYLEQQRRAQARLWLGFAAANAACIAMVVLMFYI